MNDKTPHQRAMEYWYKNKNRDLCIDDIVSNAITIALEAQGEELI